MTLIRTFDEVQPGDVDAVGGKGLSLGLMAQAGLPVPPGFCLTSTAYREAKNSASGSPQLSDTLKETARHAYARIGGGLVAVRSSATVEDGQTASFAGQQETILGVEGEQALIEAIERCWLSLDSERALAYRRQQAVDESLVAMAVVVQKLVHSEVSGVLFTRDPMDPEGRRMMVESSWGLGESVVSGRVTPDRFHLDRDDGRIVEQSINVKATMLTASGLQPVAAERQAVASLDQTQLAKLVELGRKIESNYGGPRDVEWAWADHQFYILQARPITTAGAFEREQVRREEIARLQAMAEPRGTVWSKYNLAEILPAPTPMTWSIVRWWMSGRGGYGQMFRDLGFDPDPIIDELGFIDLVCGRPYVNLSRESKLYFRRMPLAHSFKAIKENPALAFYPQATPDSEGVTGGFLIRLPIILWRIMRNYSRLKRQPRWYADYLRKESFPRFAREFEAARAEDMNRLSPSDVLDRLELWIRKTLFDFTRESLRPSVFAGNAIGQLEMALKKTMPAEQAAAGVRALLAGVHPDPDADLAGALRSLADGTMQRGEFLHRFGHRGPLEMELAQPRWGERPELLDGIGGQRPSPTAASRIASPTPHERWRRLAVDAKLNARQATSYEPILLNALTYSSLRETSKHFLMLGYGQIRRCLVELDRRFDLHGGIFYLEWTDLLRLVQGERFNEVITNRKQRRTLALSLDLPAVLFSDDLEAIGRPPRLIGGTDWKGTPLSAGSVEGTALVLEEPVAPAQLPADYILVCPSTDPAWVPLFLRAKGLVMETGGVLSHGAIVAREFNVPAVAGIGNIHKQLRSGQRIRVDGNTGTVHVFAD